MLKVTATQLKVRLGKYMKAVREGKTVVVTDRERPVARLVPFSIEDTAGTTLEVWQPRDPVAPPLGALRVASLRYSGKSTTTLLAEDRRRR